MARLTLVLLTTAALLASSVYGTPNPSPAAATPLPPTYSILPVLPDSCSRPGGVLCCSEIVAPDSVDGQEVMRELGVNASEVDAPIGVKCFSHSPLLQVVCANPVCCSHISKPYIGAAGCVRVPLP